MPLREYHCKNCGHAFEVLESTRSPKKATCQVCRSTRVERQLSVFATATAARAEAAPPCGDCSCAGSCDWES